METQADDYSFEPSSKTPGLTDGTGASGASHGENQMMLDLKLSEIEAKNERAKQYAEDFNISHREAYDNLYNSREGKQTDPNTRRADITRVGWCALTNSDPTPCGHTSAVRGCTHCEYNAGCDIPASCTHGRSVDMGCSYCRSTYEGSSSEDET